MIVILKSMSLSVTRVQGQVLGRELRARGCATSNGIHRKLGGVSYDDSAKADSRQMSAHANAGD
jgi:hypothetical protein